MKKKLALCVIAALTVTGAAGCQTATKSWGGTTKFDLEENQKLEEVTWKDDDLWILTRPMREDEEPEVHSFKERSNLGILEGEVIITEKKGK